MDCLPMTPPETSVTHPVMDRAADVLGKQGPRYA